MRLLLGLLVAIATAGLVAYLLYARQQKVPQMNFERTRLRGPASSPQQDKTSLEPTPKLGFAAQQPCRYCRF